jgi:hypothetical protein
MPSIRQLATIYEPGSSAGIGYAVNGVHYPAHLDRMFAAIGHGSWVWSREFVYDGTARAFNFNQGIPVQYDRNNTTLTTRVFGVRPAAGEFVGARPVPNSPAQPVIPPRNPYVAERAGYAASPASVVRRFYGLLNASDYAGAYALFSPDFQRHVSFARWRNGYATTMDSLAYVPETDDPHHVGLRLVAHDNKNGVLVTTVYEGAWSLIPDGRGGWLLDDGLLRQVSQN